MLLVIIGNTRRNAVKMGVLSGPNQRKARRMRERTGVAAINEKNGRTKAAALLLSPVTIPAATERNGDE